MQLITHDFIESNATPRGAWTKTQLEVLGVQWPPREGWKYNLVLEKRYLTREQVQAFKDARFVPAKKTKRKKRLTTYSENQATLF